MRKILSHPIKNQEALVVLHYCTEKPGLYYKKADPWGKQNGGNRSTEFPPPLFAYVMSTCPAATLKETVEEMTKFYQSCLDQIEEVLNTYNSTHAIICVGDFNASLKERPSNLQDRQFIEFVHRNSLGHLQSGTPTFYHPNKADCAEIDYVLFNERGRQLVDSVRIETKTAANTSDHVPVIATLKIEASYTQIDSYTIRASQNGTNVIHKSTKTAYLAV